ncbi:Ig-like domain-containing protein [Archangium lipolyticum]|uniref:Ig-like domain-containing protein n=1 Tax=Archangium lipolyticum TaxID=2970465 RepID=UPI002149D5D7|nr:Ig-like domain-containing protein [Archangium lipolyticum]
MPLRTKFLVPVVLLSCFGCINVPDVDGQQPDSGTVDPQGGFSLSISGSTQASVFQGGSHTFPLSLSRTDGFSDDVSVSLVNPPAGISAQPATIASGSSSGSLTVSVDANAAPGTTTLTVRAAAGSLSRETTVSLTVVRQGDLLVKWESPSQGQAYVKDSVQLRVAVEGGTADFVELLKGATVLARLTGSPYQYTWDTTQESEGSHQLTARATRGGASFTSPAITVTVDRTAPVAQTRTPEAGSNNVSARQAFQVTFSEALKASSVTDSSILVRAGGTNVAKTLALSTDGKTLTLTPTEPLPVPSTVTISLGMDTAPLTDLAGNTLSGSTAWLFSLPVWLPVGGALSAVTGNTPAENVAMKVGTDGNPVVAWAELGGTAKNIHAHRWNGTKWEALGGALSAVDGNATSADMPAMSITSDNQIYLVWREYQSNGTSINLHGKKWSGAWEALPEFGPLPDSETRGAPAMTLASSNTPVVVTSRYNGTLTYLEPLFWLNPTHNFWSAQFSIEQPTNRIHNVGWVQVATVAAKNAEVVAYDAYSDSLSVRGIAVQKSNGAGLLGGEVVTSPLKRKATYPSLTLDGADNPYIAWQECPDGSEQSGCVIYAARWDGSAWKMLGTSPINGISTDNTAPSLIMGNDGHPLIAWSGFSSPERSIRVSRWTGSEWQLLGAPLSAASGISTAAFKPVLTLDNNGQPLVAWHESDGTASNIYVYRYNY